MPLSRRSTKYPLDRGFTLVELLVAIVVAALLMAGLTGFYVAEQRALRHHQVEVETSQALRTALEQMSRDLRSARKDLSASAAPTFLTAGTTIVEFQLDANDDGVVTGSSPDEHKGFRLTGTSLETLDAAAGAWSPLADHLDTNGLTLTYLDCARNPLGAPVASPNDIASILISMTATRRVIGGLPVSRTETESVRLRNKRCS